MSRESDARLEISRIEIAKLDPRDFIFTTLSDFYITRLMHLANDLGLKGKKIKEVVGVEDLQNGSRYIDFFCDKHPELLK